METATKRLYEGLFLVDSAKAAADWEGTIAAIEKTFSRSEAEVVTLEKWDERRLAYEIKGKSRGTYILAYFNCDPLKIAAIERDVQLSEEILRVMILKTDKMSKEDIEKETPIVKAQREEQEAIEKAKAEAAEKKESSEEAGAGETGEEPAAEEAEKTEEASEEKTE